MVHVVDDDDIFRDYTALTLGRAGYAVAQYASGPALLEAVDEAPPGCILLDVHMEPLNGLQVQEALNARGVTWPVIVLTAAGDIRLAVEAMKNGALEFLEKPFETDGLLTLMESAFEKLEVATEAHAQAAHAKTLVDSLSPRELEVLRGLLAGLPSKLIAHALDLSVRTVEIYRSKLMLKLQVRNLSAALRLALAAGVEPLET